MQDLVLGHFPGAEPVKDLGDEGIGHFVHGRKIIPG